MHQKHTKNEIHGKKKKKTPHLTQTSLVNGKSKDRIKSKLTSRKFVLNFNVLIMRRHRQVQRCNTVPL